MRGEPSRPDHLPKAPPIDTTTWGLGFNIEFCGDGNLQILAHPSWEVTHILTLSLLNGSGILHYILSVSGFFHSTWYLRFIPVVYIISLYFLIDVNFPLKEDTWCFSSPVPGYLDCFQFLAVTTNAAVNVYVRLCACLCMDLCIQKVEFLNHSVACLGLVEIACFPKWLYYLHLIINAWKF